MGFIRCNSCRKDMSDSVSSCPYCGASVSSTQNYGNSKPVKKQSNKNGLAAVIVIIGLLWLIPKLGNHSKNADTNGVVANDNTSNVNATVSYEEGKKDFFYYENQIGDIEYFAYIEIKNTGSANIYLKDCSFDFVDGDGHLLTTESYVSTYNDVVHSGESGYFYTSMGASTFADGVNLSNGVNFQPKYTVVQANGDAPELKVSDTGIHAGDWGSPCVTGRITNDTGEDISLIYVQVIFYEKSNNIIGFGGTNITDVKNGDTVSFEYDAAFSNNKVNMDNVGRYEVLAETVYYQF